MVLSRRRILSLVGSSSALAAMLPLGAWVAPAQAESRGLSFTGAAWRRLEVLHQNSFAPQVGTRFLARSPSVRRTARLVLSDVIDHAEPGDTAGECFTLVFTAQAQRERLAEETHLLRHPTLGLFPLFLQPSDAGLAGTRYVALVNRRFS